MENIPAVKIPPQRRLIIILAIFLPVFFVAILTAVVFLARRGEDLVGEIGETASAGQERRIKNPRVVVTPDPFKNWGTYTNLLAGYKIGYPPEMVVRNAEAHKDPDNVGEKTFFVNIIRLDEIDDYRFHKVAVKPIKIDRDFDYEGWLNNFRGWPLMGKKESMVSVAGREMLTVEGKGKDGERELYYKVYAFKNIRGDYAVAILTQNPAEESDRSVFDKIISTLELLDTTPSPSPSVIPTGGAEVPEGFSPGDF